MNPLTKKSNPWPFFFWLVKWVWLEHQGLLITPVEYTYGHTKAETNKIKEKHRIFNGKGNKVSPNTQTVPNILVLIKMEKGMTNWSSFLQSYKTIQVCKYMKFIFCWLLFKELWLWSCLFQGLFWSYLGFLSYLEGTQYFNPTICLCMWLLPVTSVYGNW